MDDYRIDSQGFSVGRWYVPRFSLGRGECVSLRLPKETWRDKDRLVACLTGSEPVPGLTLRATIVFAEPALSPSGWRRWLHDPTPFDWLKKYTTLSDDAIMAFLHKHRMDRWIPLSRYAGTPRMVLGLAAAYARKPDVIVFSTAGLDPLGLREVFQIVSEHLPECSAVYLARPFVCEGQEHHEFIPGSTSVSVTDKEGLSAPGNAAMPAARGESDIAKAPK